MHEAQMQLAIKANGQNRKACLSTLLIKRVSCFIFFKFKRIIIFTTLSRILLVYSSINGSILLSLTFLRPKVDYLQINTP